VTERTERFFFTATETGLTLALNLTLSLRRHGFRTRLTTERVAHFDTHVVHATPRPRPNRRERGCLLEGGR